MSPTCAANGDSTRSPPQPRVSTPGETRWPCPSWSPQGCSHVRRAGARARPPPSPRRVRDRPTTPHDRRAASPLARGPRTGMDELSDRPPALHRRRQVLDLVLARPHSSLPHLRATGSRRVEDLLTEIDRDPTCIIWGVTPRADSRRVLATTQVGPNYRRHGGADLG